MIYLGKKQTLKVVKITENGVYLSSDTQSDKISENTLPSKIISSKLISSKTLSSKENKFHKDNNVYTDNSILNIDKVLLPKNQVTPEMTLNSNVEVFIYKDSEDRPIASTLIPALALGSTAKLKVNQINKIGAFLDWGLAKDLFLPFKEQTYRPSEGDIIPVALYIDKSQRLCATMKLYNYLRSDSPYKKDDHVSGIIYEIIDSFGAFVAVDDIYSALIPKKELFKDLKAGQKVECRVTVVNDDGKLTLSIREKAYIQIDKDANLILDALKLTSNGFLPYHDKSDAADIKEHFAMSKNAFKRAIGHLMKEGCIDINENGIKLRF